MKVCAAGLLFKDNRVFLGKRSPDLKLYPGVWDLIGGHSEEGETLEQALRRELRQEIGVTPTTFNHIAIFRDPDPQSDEEYEYHIYLVTSWEGSPRNLSPEEHSELGWFEIEEALRLKLAHPKYLELFKDIGKHVGKSR